MRLFTIALVSALSSAAVAESVNYRVNATGWSRATFESDAPLESIIGITTKAEGTIKVDKDKPSAATAKIEIDVASFNTGNTMRDGHLRSKDWLDADAFPKITFELTEVTGLEALAAEKYVKATAEGKLTIRGVTKKVTVPVRVGLFPYSEKLKKLMPYVSSDVLRVSTRFEIRLSDYGVKIPEMLGLKVSEVVKVRVDVTAVRDTGIKPKE